MSDLWLLPLGVGAGGALVLVLAIRKLNSTVDGLRHSMRPLRVSTRPRRDDAGSRTP